VLLPIRKVFGRSHLRLMDLTFDWSFRLALIAKEVGEAFKVMGVVFGLRLVSSLM
jgi:hypothetical protein